MHLRKRRSLNFSENMPDNLASNQRFQFAAVHALNIFRSDSIYTLIPKNACSTMRFTLAMDNGFIGGEQSIEWIHANNATFSASLRDLAVANYTFVILRDPFTRIASYYLDKIVHEYDRTLALKAVSDDRCDLSNLTFRQFVRKIIGHLDLDMHWKPQVDFLVYKEYDRYFSLENFDAACGMLKEEIGLEVHDARKLTGHGVSELRALETRSGFADATSSEIRSMKSQGCVPKYRNMYDDQLLSEIGRLYEADIDFYRSKFSSPLLYDE